MTNASMMYISGPYRISWLHRDSFQDEKLGGDWGLELNPFHRTIFLGSLLKGKEGKGLQVHNKWRNFIGDYISHFS